MALAATSALRTKIFSPQATGLDRFHCNTKNSQHLVYMQSHQPALLSFGIEGCDCKTTSIKIDHITVTSSHMYMYIGKHEMGVIFTPK